MTGGGQAAPLRRTGSAQGATFLELFFDLVYVFALTRISFRAFEDLALQPGGTTGWSPVTGGLKTLLLLLALWTIWQGVAWTTSRYDPHHGWLQLVVIVALIGSMVMGVAIPRAFTSAGLTFAVAYVVTQVFRPGLLLVALRSHEYRRLKLRMLLTYCATGVLWLTGAFLPPTARGVCWALALLAEYLAVRFGWPVPGLGRSTASRWDVAGEHLAERYQQFFLVALGETILVAGMAYSTGPFDPARTAAFAVALVTSVLLWRIYVQRAGQILAEAVMRSRHPSVTGRSAADTHLVMVVGLVGTAIGYELTIEHPLAAPEAAWVVLVVGGPVLFLLGRTRFEYEVFGRVSPSRWIAAASLVVLFPLLLHVVPLVSAVAAMVVLGAVAAADARRARGRPPEPAAPPL